MGTLCWRLSGSICIIELKCTRPVNCVDLEFILSVAHLTYYVLRLYAIVIWRGDYKPVSYDEQRAQNV